MHGALLRSMVILTSPLDSFSTYLTVPLVGTPVAGGRSTGLDAFPVATYSHVSPPSAGGLLDDRRCRRASGVDAASSGGIRPQPASMVDAVTTTTTTNRRVALTGSLWHNRIRRSRGASVGAGDGDH